MAELGTAQILAWGSSYYLPAILADPIAQGTGVSRTVVFGLFSGVLLLSAVFGSAVGRAINGRDGCGLLVLGGSGGTGSELMRRIAVPMVGGMVSSTLLTLLVIPAIYALVKGWPLRRGTAQAGRAHRATKPAE